MSFFKIFTALSLIGVLFANVSLIGPSELKDILKNIDGGGKLIFIILYLVIRNIIGNFGAVPYGKTITGFVYYQKNLDETNNWCDYEQTVTPPDLTNIEDAEYNSIFIVDQ